MRRCGKPITRTKEMASLHCHRGCLNFHALISCHYKFTCWISRQRVQKQQLSIISEGQHFSRQPDGVSVWANHHSNSIVAKLEQTSISTMLLVMRAEFSCIFHSDRHVRSNSSQTNRVRIRAISSFPSSSLSSCLIVSFKSCFISSFSLNDSTSISLLNSSFTSCLTIC